MELQILGRQIDDFDEIAVLKVEIEYLKFEREYLLNLILEMKNKLDLIASGK